MNWKTPQKRKSVPKLLSMIVDYDSGRRETHSINCWEITEMSIDEKIVAAWALATHLCNGCLI